MSKANYTFKYDCDSCGNKPVLKDLSLCSVCCYGEAASLWEWLDDEVTNVERKAARKRLDHEIKEMGDAGMFDEKGNFDPIAAQLLHLNQHVLDRIEAIYDRPEERKL